MPQDPRNGLSYLIEARLDKMRQPNLLIELPS